LATPVSSVKKLIEIGNEIEIEIGNMPQYFASLIHLVVPFLFSIYLFNIYLSVYLPFSFSSFAATL
jgi:hypothetical protein